MSTFILNCLLLASGYPEAQAELDAAIAAAQHEPEANVDRVAQALAEIDEFHDSLRGDASALEARARARVALAQLYIATEQPDLAAAIMDLAVREAWAAELPVAEFGPSVVALFDERARTLEAAGRARIGASCSSPCRMFVDEAPSPNPSPPLLLGAHRVVITDLDGGDLRSELVVLREVDDVVEVQYGSTPELAKRKPTLAPLTLLGVATLGAGAATMAFGAYEYTRGRVVVTDYAARTRQTFKHDKWGGWFLGTGLAVATVGAVLVVVSELRPDADPRRPRLAFGFGRAQVGVTLTGRF